MLCPQGSQLHGRSVLLADQQYKQLFPYSLLGSLIRRTVTFTTSATGTIGATVDWTFATNDIDIYLTSGTNLCSIDQFNNDECQFLGSTTSVTTKPETVSVPNLAAGPYTVYLVNWGSTDDSVGYQITLTR